MKKKLLAFLTAIVCAGSMSALSVSASELSYTSVVVMPGDTYCLMRDGCTMGYEHFKEYASVDFDLKYGDVFAVHTNFSINPMFPATYLFWEDADPEYEYLGTVSDIYRTKELIVTSISDGFVSMEDEENTSYRYTYYSKNRLKGTSVKELTYPEEVNPENFQIGDKILCAVEYNEYAGNLVVLPVEVTERSETVLTGDANRDGTLDILDVVLVNKVIFGKAQLPDILLKQIDFNENNIPDAGDTLIMMKMIVGLA